MKRTLWSCLFLLFAFPIHAQAGNTCVLIQNVTAYTPEGKRENVEVLIRGGRVHFVGKNAASADRSGSGWCPGGTKIISGEGRVLTAGFVEPYSQLGLVEVSLEASTVDAHAVAQPKLKPPQIHASYRSHDAYNPRSSLIPITRAEGVLSAVSVPEGGLISGQSIWVDLAGQRQAEAVRNPTLAVHGSMLGSERPRTQLYAKLRVLLEHANATAKSSARKKSGFTSEDLVVMRQVLAKKMPLVVRADRAADIEALVRMKRAYGFELVIAGGAEAWLLADLLAKEGVAVIINPLVAGPHTFDGLAGRLENAAILDKAGVPLMMSTFWTHNARTLRQIAGNAVRAGLPHTSAIRALTQTPASIFGMSEHGRIAKGARANLVLWSGDPLEISSHVVQAWVGGVAVSLESRQSVLLERYRSMKADPTTLPLP